MENLDQDTPLGRFKTLFPADKKAKEKVLRLMLNAANQATGIYHIDHEDLESHGLSKPELDILTLIKIDALVEPEIAYYD